MPLPISVCDLPKVIVSCPDDAVRLWYYDKATDYCRRYGYGEYGGNANNFTSLDDCKKVKVTYGNDLTLLT